MGVPQKRKATAGEQAAFLNAPNDTIKITAARSFKQRIKRLIVALALWGLLAISAADWLIQSGGLRHE